MLTLLEASFAGHTLVGHALDRPTEGTALTCRSLVNLFDSAHHRALVSRATSQQRLYPSNQALAVKITNPLIKQAFRHSRPVANPGFRLTLGGRRCVTTPRSAAGPLRLALGSKVVVSFALACPPTLAALGRFSGLFFRPTSFALQYGRLRYWKYILRLEKIFVRICLRTCRFKTTPHQRPTQCLC